MIELEAAEDTAETPETRIKTTETREEGKGGAAKMRDNGDGRQGWRWRRVAEIAAAEMWNNRDSGDRDTGRWIRRWRIFP